MQFLKWKIHFQEWSNIHCRKAPTNKPIVIQNLQRESYILQRYTCYIQPSWLRYWWLTFTYIFSQIWVLTLFDYLFLFGMCMRVCVNEQWAVIFRDNSTNLLSGSHLIGEIHMDICLRSHCHMWLNWMWYSSWFVIYVLESDFIFSQCHWLKMSKMTSGHLAFGLNQSPTQRCCLSSFSI